MGALIAFGTAYGADVYENLQDGFQLSDFTDTFAKNWKEYVIVGLAGAITGAAGGIGTSLGQLAFKAGVRIAAKTAIPALIATTAGAFISGIGIYTLETKVFGLKEFNQSDMWKAGAHLGTIAAYNFGANLLLGNQGFAEKNIPFQDKFIINFVILSIEKIIDTLFEL